jgi:hypothetical protein
VLAEQQRSALAGKEQPLDEEMKLLRNYNEVLFNKLETKMQELQQDHCMSSRSMKNQ